MTNNLAVLLSFILALSFTSSAQTELQEGWVIEEKTAFSISHPEEWEFNESGQMGTTFIMLSPLATEEDDFRENVNLLMQNLKGLKLDLDAYIEISEGQVSQIFPDGDIIKSKRHTSGTDEFHEIIYTGKQSDFDLKFRAFCWLKDDYAYVLTLTCEVDQYENYETIGEEILSSFILN
jgi:hypothetical protein